MPGARERPHGLVLVGCGRMGKVHLGVAESSPEVAVKGVVDPVMAQGDPTTVRPRCAWELGELPLDEVDVVLIASPTATHDELVMDALERGKHVLCEKPLTLNPERDRALGELAEEHGLILQVGFWRRFSQPYRVLRSLLRNGHIGEIKGLRASQWDAQPPAAEFCAPEQSGGIEIDCGVHEFDLASWLLGNDVISVTAHAAPPVPALAAVGDRDTVFGLARLSDEKVMTIDLTRTAGGRDSIRTEVVGEEGSIVVEFADSGTITVRRRGDRQEHTMQPRDVIVDALKVQLKSFLEATRSGLPAADASTSVDSRRALIAATGLRDARKGETWCQVGY
jgi:myo-inositol 2-dehydrogenase/D-chiro-inositol 1-dehydrogenase